MIFKRCEATGHLFAKGDGRDYWIYFDLKRGMFVVVKMVGTSEREVGIYETENEANEFANWHNRCKL